MLGIQIQFDPAVIRKAERVNPRFIEKILNWTSLVREHGIIPVRRTFGDRKLYSFGYGEERKHLWATKLNARYQLLYLVSRDADRITVEIHGIETEDELGLRAAGFKRALR